MQQLTRQKNITALGDKSEEGWAMTQRAIQTAQVSQTKRAELLSSVGTGVLGGGLALLFAEILKGYALVTLIVGLAMHA